MAFSSSKVEAPQITGSLFGTASWAVSASWAPSNGVSEGVAYQTAQSGTLFDVTKTLNGLPSTRSIGGALQPGDIGLVINENNFGGSIISHSIVTLFKKTSTGSIPMTVNGTGLPLGKFEGEVWTPIVTKDEMFALTYLPAALSSSIEGATFNGTYHSGSAVTGALYYDVATQKYRVFKGLGNGGWQDLVSSGGSSAGVAFQSAQSGTLFDVTISQPGNGPAESRSIGGASQPGDMNILFQNIEFGGGPISESIHLIYKRVSTGSKSIMSGGTGLPESRFQGDLWTPILTGETIQAATFLPAAASSSIEGAIQGAIYHSGSAVTGALYYDVSRGQYRVYKGLGNGGWQDLVTTGSGTSGQAFPYTGSAQISGSLNITQIANPAINTLSGRGQLAVGDSINLTGDGAVGLGSNLTANGAAALATGYMARAIGTAAHSEGFQTTAKANYAHAEGQETTAGGIGSHAEGHISRAIGLYSHAEGSSTQADGVASHAEGYFTQATGQGSHAEGYYTIAAGQYQTVVGQWNVGITSRSAFIIGDGTGISAPHNLFYASGGRVEISGSLLLNGVPITPSAGGAFPFTGSAAVSGTFQLDSGGSQRNKFATSSFLSGQPIVGAAAFGTMNEISSSNAFAFGYGNRVVGQQSMAVGGQNIISELSGVSFAAGSSNLITASVVHNGTGGGAQIAMGYRATSSAILAIAIGTAVHAAGTSSFAQGGLLTRSGSSGGGNIEILASGGLALGGASHAEGLYTTAIGVGSHAEGGGFIPPLSGSWSSLVGIQGGVAIGSGSHAEGRETTAIGNWSHTQGLDTVALGDYQFVAGQWNELVPSSSAFIVGDGTSESARKNLLYASGGRVDISGSLYINGTQVTSGGGGGAAFPYTGSAKILGTLSIDSTTKNTTIADGCAAVGGGNYVLSAGGFASGYDNYSLGQASHAEGNGTSSGGLGSHSEGSFTKTDGSFSHAEGEASSTLIAGLGGHAEGSTTVVAGRTAHAEGSSTTAIGQSSHTEGFFTTAIGVGSHAAGYYSVTSGSYQSVVGQFNQSSSIASAFIIGNGTFTNVRSNLMFAAGNNVQITGSLLIQSASVNGEAVSNIGDTFTSTAKVTKMVTCTAAEYAAIGTKDPNTFYIVI